MILPVLLLVLFLLVPQGAGAATPATTGPEVSTLPTARAEPLDRTLEPGEVHVYSVNVDAPTLLVVQIERRGVNTASSLIGPTGDRLTAVSGPGGPWSEEVLAEILTRDGEYRVLVTTAADEEHRGDYRLLTVELRGAAAEDAARVAAEHLFSAALQESEIPTGGENSKHRSIEMLRTISAIFDSLDEQGRRADALHVLGATLLKLNELEPALAALREEWALRRELGDSAREAWGLELITRILVRRGDFAGAMEVIDQARALAMETGDPELQATVDNTLGYVHFQQQDYNQAIAPFQRAVSGHRTAGNAREEAIALMNLGQALRTTGDDTKRCSAIEESARILETLRYPFPLAFIYLGDCRQKQGRIAAAVSAYDRALEQARAEGDSVNVSLALLYSASLLAHLGEYERAERRIEEAQHALAGGASTDLSAHLELHRGWLALAQGDATAALRRFEAALGSLGDGDGGSYQRSIASAHRAMGDALIELGRPREAVEHLETAERLSRDAAERRPAEALRKLGVAYMAVGDLSTAERHLDLALEEVGDDDPAQEGATRSQLARLAMRQGKLQQALAEIESAIEIRESVRATVAPPSLRASYLARWRDDYGLAIDLMVTLSEEADETRARELSTQALAMSERAHSRTLQELLVEARSHARVEVPAELAARQRRAEERLAQLSRRLTSGELTAEQEAEVSQALDATTDELMSIEWRLRDPAIDTDAAPAFHLATLQEELGTDEALLEYFLGEEASHLFLVTRHAVSVYRLGASDEIGDLVALTRSGLVAEHRYLWPRLNEVSRKLYDRLIAPAEDELVGVERLIIVPDQELFYLPFEVLLRERPPPPATTGALAGRYLVDRWHVGYVPAATVLSQLRPTSPPTDSAGSKKLIAFADPVAEAGRPPPDVGAPEAGSVRQSRRHGLPGAREEIASIADLMAAEDVLVFLGDQASEERLAGQDEPTRWYHFAVHGILDQRHPELSGLVLADGELQVHEIYDLELDAELVVLSACETGLGKRISGEELIGLSRAFFYAGVPTVVVSLWRVADRSTASLMVAFYRELLAGNDPVSSMTAAKRWLMTETEWQHPYHWAPFVVLGYPRPAPSRNARPPSAPNGTKTDMQQVPRATPVAAR